MVVLKNFATFGIPARTIQKYELGECNIANITLIKAIALADALGVDPRDLLAKD